MSGTPFSIAHGRHCAPTDSATLPLFLPLHRSPVSQRRAAEGFLEDAREVIRVVVAEFGRDFFHAQGRGVQIMACGLHP